MNFPVAADNVFYALQKIQKDDYFNVTFKSNLLEKSILATRDIKWVDLENDYFDELIACKNLATKAFLYDKVIELNEQFQYLKQRLESYLLSVQFEDRDFKEDPEIKKVFRSAIQKEDLLLDKTGGGKAPERRMFLNFNYTNTLAKYLGVTQVFSPVTQMTTERKDTINYIHGKLGDISNPIVFGFGDEYDSNYQQFELLRNNEVFRHIKSFAYLKTRNYHDLIRFLMLDKFQVLIVGHSCGLSDRTMFREIFSHENCRCIKIFYYKRPDGTTDFTQKTYDMAKYFTDKGEMRKKVVPEPLSSPLPQYNQEHLVRKKKL